MKKLFFLFVLIAFASVSANAQEMKPDQKKMQHQKVAECYVMKDGKMYHAMAGKEMLMEKEVTLKNGEKIMPDGMCKMKDGKEMMLKNDECIDVMGRHHKSHLKHEKKV